MDTPVISENVKKVQALPDNLQRQVLIFVDALQVSSTRGTPGKSLLKFAGKIPLDELKAMSEAIESGCEQVDSNEW
jgi:hypothetical protein